MSKPDLTRLTANERQALHLLHRHRYITKVADVIGISDSGVKARLESATKRTGIGRWELATLVAEDGVEGDCRIGPRLEQQVPDAENLTSSWPPSAGEEPVRLSETRATFEYATPSPGLPLPPLTRNQAGGHRLTGGQKLAAIAIWCLIATVIFCLLIATMTVFGNLGLNLRRYGVSRL